MARLLLYVLAVFVVGGLLFGLSMRGRPAAYRRRRWIKFATYLAIVLAAFVAWRIGPPAFGLLAAAIGLRGAYEILDARRAAGALAVPAWSLAVYLPIAALAVVGAALARPDTVMFAFIVIATFDGCSQVTGQLVGRRQLAPRTSPNKTVEGLIGGLAFAVAAAWVARGLSPLGGPAAALVGIPMGLVGLAGDLSKSWLKRRAGIKDFRAVLPGHGGVLDRFDGLLPNLAILGLLVLWGLRP